MSRRCNSYGSATRARMKIVLQGGISGLFAVLFLLAPAVARETNGALGLIQTPNNGMPAIVAPGQTFEAVLKSRATLRLVLAEKEYPLEVVYAELPGGQVHAACTVPAETGEGAYALVGEADGKSDRNNRAVYVRKEFPEYYVIGHVTDTHIGSSGAEALVRTVFQTVNQSEAAIVLVTGDLTDGGDPAQFLAFLDVLDTCTLPTFVCPGNHDRTANNYEQFFGPLVYFFRFGQDGYLSFDTKDFVIADDLGPQDGALERYRRVLKPCRWTVGFTHRYDPTMGMRSQLILFVDDPLDFLLFGHWHRENTEEEKVVPWGTTHVSVAPAAKDGHFRLLDMTARGLLARPVQKVEAAK